LKKDTDFRLRASILTLEKGLRGQALRKRKMGRRGE
jgi:hypothetical protein